MSSQEYKDVKEKVEQLAPWLTKLNNLTIVTTDVDSEEKERREELFR